MLLLGVSKMLALLDRVSLKKLVERLRVCVRTDGKISVKGALGVGGGGEEWLKTYTCVRTGGGIVL